MHVLLQYKSNIETRHREKYKYCIVHCEALCILHCMQCAF